MVIINIAAQSFAAKNASRHVTSHSFISFLRLNVATFTTLHQVFQPELERAVGERTATEDESNESKLSADLNAGILKRYHEEQIWSDRIRRQSTWGTWGLMGVNILLFLSLQFVAEPWRRKRLMKHIAASEKLVMDDVKRELAEVRAALESSGLREQEKRADREAAASASAVAAAAALSAMDATAEPVEASAPPLRY